MEKIRLHSYTYGCFLVSGAKVVQFLSIKTSIPCSFYSCLNSYLKNREGKFLATTICPLATKNLYLIASWRPYQKVNFGPWIALSNESVFNKYIYIYIYTVKKAFSMTYRNNVSFKRTLSQPLNINTLDVITF